MITDTNFKPILIKFGLFKDEPTLWKFKLTIQNFCPLVYVNGHLLKISLTMWFRYWRPSKGVGIQRNPGDVLVL